MSQRLRRLLPYFGYATVFWTCFWVFAYFTFPYDRLRDYIVHHIEYKTLPGGRVEPTGYQVSIVNFSPYWFTGVHIQGLRIVTQPATPDDQPTNTNIPAITARLQVLPLFIGRVQVNFDADLPGGSLAGSYATTFTQRHTWFNLEMQDVNLRQLQIVRQVTQIPMRGVVNGTIDLDAPSERNSASGVIDLRIKGMQLGDGTSRIPLPSLPAGIVTEPIDAGNMQIRIDIARGEGNLRRFDADGADLKLEGSGTIHLQQPLGASRIDVLLRARFTDAYKEKSELAKTMLTLLETNPVLRRARSSDNWHQVRLRGTAGVRIVPTPAGDERPPARR